MPPDDEAIAMIRAEGFDPNKMHLMEISDGQVALAFNQLPTPIEMAAYFPIETKAGGRLTPQGGAQGMTADGMMIVYPAAYVAGLRAEALHYIFANITVNRKHPEMARCHAAIRMTTPKRRRDIKAMKSIWGES